jgi:hypothetical protein
MRYPWLGIPFAAPRPGRAAVYPPRRERAADRRPRALLAAPALALSTWLGLITVATVDGTRRAPIAARRRATRPARVPAQPHRGALRCRGSSDDREVNFVQDAASPAP